ncbi:MATE family efflux transporter [Nonomuraea deserti]|uniref:Probable multidrug resistance protein NorM n=1 Tax=Nonomuraea deserti TaxID=1848322 RepID=A0A4R4VBI9_9ACTN|nr:MATE family efflux transporter [Nonomuraea deserti]TDC99284.1 MATE family efflux transporter [Nonomuraea deserti]
MPRLQHRAIAAAAVPLFLSMIVNQVAGLVGTAVLGRRATAALAAYAVMAAVLNPAFTAITGALRGMAPFIAPHREHPPGAIPVLRDARWLALVVGALAAAAVACVPLVASLGGAPPEVLAELGILPYLLVVYVLLYGLGGGANAALIALGHSRQVIWASLAGAAVSIVLVVTLVPRIGLPGLGCSMIAAGATALAVSNLRLRRLLGGGVGRGRPRPAEIMKLARVGIPLSGTLLIKFAVLGVVTYAAVRTGTREAAAHAVLYAIMGPLMFMSLSVAQASVPEVARAHGVREVRSVTRAALALAVAGVAAGGSLLLAFRDPLVTLFTSDDGVRTTVLGLAWLVVVMAAVDGTQAVVAFGLAGLKRSSWSLGSVAAGYGMLTVAAVLVAATWGLAGLWWALIANSALLFVLQASGFLRHSARANAAPG